MWNFKSKLPETRVFIGTCYVTKRSCTSTDGGNPTKKFNFWVTSHFKIFPLLMKKLYNVHAMWFFKLSWSRSGEESHQTGSQTPELFISSFLQFLKEKINCKRGAKVSCIAWTLYFWIQTVCSRIYIIKCSSKSSRLFKLCLYAHMTLSVQS